MPRPRKRRRVCGLPQSSLFGPLGRPDREHETIVMTVDEYETIRLIDLVGLTQEKCAEQMNVARTTVQRIYNEARKKLAEALVYGRTMRIAGGDYLICDDAETGRGCGRRCRHRLGRG